MQKLEKKIEIESSPEKIYNIIKDGVITPKWNPTVSAITFEDENTLLETDFGAMKIVNAKYDKNKSTTWFMEKSNMNSMGYVLIPKKKATVVTLWTEFNDKELFKIFKKSSDLLLVGLKRYIEFLEKGGNSDHYNKWEFLPPT
ncbi:MAG: hypothetical protein CEE43_06970 [Promethearchaeota archaeon Loki_b32]|nr:MAG: hypothetical protein CEE43_06970 [Candidatus Lokiarchaeota archaeon Loki_b32]